MSKEKKDFEEKEKEENERISRRSFLAGSMGFAVGLASGSTTSSLAYPPKEQVERKIRILESLYGCPFCGEDFENEQKLKNHIFSNHQNENENKKPGITQLDEPTYEEMVITELERFNPKYVAFARSVWDQEYRQKLLEVSDKEEMPHGGFFSFMEGPKNKEDIISSIQANGAMYCANNFGNPNKIPYGYVHQTNGGGLYSWKEPIADEKAEVEDKEELTEHVKRMAELYGADLVGITELDSKWIYTHQNKEGLPKPYPGEKLSLDGAPAPESQTNISYDYAIVMAVEQEWWRLMKSPGYAHTASTRRGYDDMAMVAPRLAEFIRGLGYAAVPSGNDTTQSIPLAIDAGLGQIGRHGLLITPEFGARQRICKVYTNLPLEQDKPIDFGMQEYCENCRVCARVCPANAVPKGDRFEGTTKSNREGMKRWVVDTPSCLAYWVESDNSCSNCQAFCPWSSPTFRRERFGYEKNKEMWGESQIYSEEFY
ncbi:hypothetical protein C9439_00460 [archaeon SCG-AAA382B04]|nr:hypothetical protein C9439_00460 [archaeon SCG-AAA382B04]